MSYLEAVPSPLPDDWRRWLEDTFRGHLIPELEERDRVNEENRKQEEDRALSHAVLAHTVQSEPEDDGVEVAENEGMPPRISESGDDLHDMTLAELRERAAEMGLPTYGKKAVLIERIQNA